MLLLFLREMVLYKSDLFGERREKCELFLFGGNVLVSGNFKYPRSIIKFEGTLISLSACLSVIVYMSAGNNTAWNLPRFGILYCLLQDTPQNSLADSESSDIDWASDARSWCSSGADRYSRCNPSDCSKCEITCLQGRIHQQAVGPVLFRFGFQIKVVVYEDCQQYLFVRTSDFTVYCSSFL